MKFVICGHSRHGKDTLAEILSLQFGLTSESSSYIAKDTVYRKSELLQSKYLNSTDAWLNRHNEQSEWFSRIADMNTPDKTGLAAVIFGACDVYCGMREIDELRACLKRWPDITPVWVDASERLPAESEESNTITANDCEFTICNNGTEREFERKVCRHFIKYKGL